MNGFDLAATVSIAAGGLYVLVIGVVLRRQGFRERTGALLILYATALCLLELARAFSRLGWFAFITDAAWAQAIPYGILILSWVFLHLSRSFLRLKGAGWGWWGLGIVWFAALIAFESNLLVLPEALLINARWLIGGQGLSFRALLVTVGWGISMGGAAFLTVIAYSRMRQPLHRNRIVYWFLVLILTIPAAVLLFVVSDAGYWPLSSGLYLLGTVSAAYAVLTHRLFDVRRAVRRMVNYLIGTLLMVAVYTAFFLVADHLFRTIPGYSPLVTGLALALVLSVFFDPLLRLAQRLVHRFLSGGVRDPSRTLREYSTRISNILDLGQLAMVAIGLISEAMGIRNGALFVVHCQEEEGDREGGYFQLRGVSGVVEDKDPISAVLPDTCPVVDLLRQDHSPLTQYDIDLHPRFQDLSASERDWFTGLGMDVYVPIYAQEEWIGLLALGPKRSGARYYDDDLALLSILADQTAVALENARLFDDLKVQHAEIERLNEELASANRELIQMSQAKSDFIDIASHELRTPLTQVRGYSDILDDIIERESLSPEVGRELTQGLQKAAKRLEEIVDTMFDVAQLDTETMHLNLMRGSVAPIVDAAVKTWATALEERKLTLTVGGLTDLPPITADGKRLRQVFSHLVQNAIKFTPDGGQIRITGRMLEWTLPQDQAIEIVVADSGIGIAPEELERIFEKFYRVGDVLLHSTGKIKFKGAGPGLGLTVARGIVEAHGGRIWAESPGCDEEACPGGEFHVVLPVQPRPPKPMTQAIPRATARDDTG